MSEPSSPPLEPAAPRTRYLPHDRVHAYVRDLFEAHGLPREDAETCARALVTADLRGVWSHGVARVPMYCGRLLTGASKARPDIRVIAVATAAALVDGDDGVGLVVARRAMAEAIALAKQHGIGLAGVRNSGHFGMAALYVAQAAEADCLGFTFTNASKALPPHGGARPFFGTSPFAFAAPTRPGQTFLADMAMSVIARGKIRYAAQRGDPIPEGCALDAEGRPTTNAEAAMEGVLLPFGGVKGAALAWMNDVIGGVFTGAAFGGDVANPTKELDRPLKTGHVFIAMRADLFVPLAEFKARMAELERRVRAEPRAAGFDEILAPGEPEARRLADHLERGLPLTPDVIANMRAAGDRVGVPWPFG